PPLRERRNEISHLTEFFIDRYARRYNRPRRAPTEELQQLFQSYEWPGNIRELENMIKRMVILQDEQLVVRELVRSAPRVAAYAGVALDSAGAPAEEPEDVDGPDDEPPPSEEVVMTAPVGRLADVAKA